MARSHHDAIVHCPECEPYPALRNHWFLGKLVTPRDLTDEHRYVAQKIRLHHQRLHGTGIVCGLEVREHDNQRCQDRLVYLTPGSAIDCCGHDVLVLERDVLDLESFPAFVQLVKTPDDRAHTLRLCLRYCECPTEEVPVLYDECACDDSECAPNRILESYAVDLLIDPPPDERPVLDPRLTWRATACAPNALATALDEPGKLLLTLSADPGALVYRTTLDELAPQPPIQLQRKGLALATDPARKLLLVAVEPAANVGIDPQELLVYDLAGSLAAPVRSHQIPNSAGSPVLLRRSPTEELVSLAQQGGRLALWEAGAPDPTPIGDVNLAADATGLAIGATGALAYTLKGGATLVEARLDGTTPETRDIATGFTAEALDVVISTAPDLVALVGADGGQPQLRLIDPANGTSVGDPVSLVHPPTAVAVGPGGQWAFVVEQGGGASWLQAVNLHLLRSGKKPKAGAALDLPAGVAGITVSDSGRRLYLPYPGGVIVVEVDEADCAALLDGGPCPGCLESDCLTLATIEGWRPGARLIDKGDETGDPAPGTAWIDNAKGRLVLPSTQAIAAALKCLIAHGPQGGGGEQGPPGKDGKDGEDGLPGAPGADGQGIDQVDLKLVECDQPAGAQLTGTSPNRTLTLTLPSCCTPERTRICDINWEHGAELSVDGFLGLLERGLIVAFDDLVRNADINLATFRLLVSVFDRDTGGLRWVQLRPQAKPPGEAPAGPDTMPVGIDLDNRCDAASAGQPVWDRTADVPAMVYRMTFEQEVPGRIFQQVQQAAREHCAYLRIEVAGDLIRDIQDRPIDANHLPPWVRAAGAGGPLGLTGDCVRGGLFESWLRIVLE